MFKTIHCLSANFMLFQLSTRRMSLSTTFALIKTLFSPVKAGTKTFLKTGTNFPSPDQNIYSVGKYSTHFLLDSDNIFTYSSNQNLPKTILVQPLSRTAIPKVSPTSRNNEWLSLVFDNVLWT